MITRNVIDPKDIFSIIEYTYPFPNFRKIRIDAQNMSNHTVDNIYLNFQIITNLSDEEIERIKEYEIKVEVDNSLPLLHNLNLVQDDDILVSDMYLKREHILQILKKNGFNKNCKIYVSPSGKYFGSMYEKLLKKYDINCHLGDNEHSDIKMSSKFNIPNKLTILHKWTKIEQDLFMLDKSYSNLFRKIKSPLRCFKIFC